MLNLNSVVQIPKNKYSILYSITFINIFKDGAEATYLISLLVTLVILVKLEFALVTAAVRFKSRAKKMKAPLSRIVSNKHLPTPDFLLDVAIG